jgi:hypothetical protein
VLEPRSLRNVPVRVSHTSTLLKLRPAPRPTSSTGRGPPSGEVSCTCSAHLHKAATRTFLIHRAFHSLHYSSQKHQLTLWHLWKDLHVHPAVSTFA